MKRERVRPRMQTADQVVDPLRRPTPVDDAIAFRQPMRVGDRRFVLRILMRVSTGDLIDDRGNLVVNLFKTVNDKSGWVLGRWNLDAYAGRTLWLYFGVHGDGHPKSSTQQFLDDVVLTAGNAPSPSPSPAAAPRRPDESHRI